METCVFKSFNKPVQGNLHAVVKCNIDCRFTYICHHKKNICFEIVNLDGPYLQ